MRSWELLGKEQFLCRRLKKNQQAGKWGSRIWVCDFYMLTRDLTQDLAGSQSNHLIEWHFPKCKHYTNENFENTNI
jgi:hypothetical protein